MYYLAFTTIHVIKNRCLSNQNNAMVIMQTFLSSHSLHKITRASASNLSYDSNNIEISWGVQIMISEAEAFISRSLFISPHHLDWCDIHLHPPKASRKNWINITYAWLCQCAWRTDARNWHFRQQYSFICERWKEKFRKQWLCDSTQ